MMKMDFLEVLKESFLEQLFPYTCPFCRKVVSFRELYCTSCAAELSWLDERYCFRCGKLQCECRESGNQLDGMIAALEYEKCVSKAILDFKYHHYYQHVKAFTDIILKRYEQMGLKETFDGIVFVPMHPKQLKQREYNHAEVLARSLAKHFQIPVFPVLKKTKQTAVQHMLSREERRKNVEQAYELAGSPDLKGKTLLLCDDIVTTGSTLNYCSSLLRKCGVERVYGILIASTQRKDVENGSYLLYNGEN